MTATTQPLADLSLTSVAEGRRRFFEWLSDRYRPIAPDPLACDAFPTSFLPSAGPNLAAPALLAGVPTHWDRVAVVQPCIRYWDQPLVGDRRHLSCFEMATFVSLRAEDRRRTLADLFDLLAAGLGLDPARFWVTVYGQGPVAGRELPADEEAAAAWRSLGLPVHRIVRVAGSEGFVANRLEAVGGYRTEVYYETAGERRELCRPCTPEHCTCGRFVEVATSVTYAYAVDFDATPVVREVAAPPVHAAGLGLERALQVALGEADVAAVDTVGRLREALLHAAPGRAPGAERAATIAADHLRALAFLAADGATDLPGRANKGRRWIVNRYERALRAAVASLGLTGAAAVRAVLPILVALHGEAYPGLAAGRAEVERRLLARLG